MVISSTLISSVRTARSRPSLCGALTRGEGRLTGPGCGSQGLTGGTPDHGTRLGSEWTAARNETDTQGDPRRPELPLTETRDDEEVEGIPYVSGHSFSLELELVCLRSVLYSPVVFPLLLLLSRVMYDTLCLEPRPGW